MYNETLQCIAETLSEIYCIDINDSIQIVNNSFVAKAIKHHSDFIEHYNAEYWAEQIMSDEIISLVSNVQ